MTRDRDQSTAMPRWVKGSLALACILGLILVVVALSGVGGPHGPGRHLPAQPGAAHPN